MIPTSEPPSVIGMEDGSEPGVFRMEPEASPGPTEAAEISMAAPEAAFVLMEPAPAMLLDPEPSSAPPPASFAEPPIAPPTPARRQYDVPAPEPAPVRTVPAPSRPSQEDLAALDQILNPHSEGPAVLDKSVAEAAARPSARSSTKSSAGARSARRGAPSRAPFLVGIGAVLALAGVAIWFFLFRPAGRRHGRTRRCPDHGEHGAGPGPAHHRPHDGPGRRAGSAAARGRAPAVNRCAARRPATPVRSCRAATTPRPRASSPRT